MRFLMIGISIIIGVILVGVVFSVTMDLTQPREVEKVVSFEILIIYDDNEWLITPGTYDKVRTILEHNDIIDVYIIEPDNNEKFEFDGYSLDTDNVEYNYLIGELLIIEVMYDSDLISTNYSYEINDIVTLIFTVQEPPQISSTSAILIALVPLLFATGVILYTYNTALRGREE